MPKGTRRCPRSAEAHVARILPGPSPDLGGPGPTSQALRYPGLGPFLLSFPNPSWILISGLWSSLRLSFTAFVCKIKVLASLVEVHVQEGVVGEEPQSQVLLTCLAHANSLPCFWVQKGRDLPQSLSSDGTAGSQSPPRAPGHCYVPPSRDKSSF